MELLLSDVISHSLISASLCDCNEGRCRTFHTDKLHNTVTTCVMMLEVQQCTLNLYSVTAGETEEMLSVEPNYLNWAEIWNFCNILILEIIWFFNRVWGGNVCSLTLWNQKLSLSWNFSFLQTNELVMSLDDDEKLILQNGQTLRAAGVSKFVSAVY